MNDFEKELRKFRNTDLKHRLITSIILLGPTCWILINDSPTKTYLCALLNIPILFLLGFDWGRNSMEKELFTLAKEADELEEKLEHLTKYEKNIAKTE